MKPDIPIIGQNSATNQLLSTELFMNGVKDMLEHAKKFDMLLKIQKLRESCGVVDQQFYTVNVRLPPRYLT